ncbi:hypothetical protein E3A20_14190 [Planctomyces bekefii]|uniref:Uncharacterized protein n=1 Tax=Planctomyces bekefii TaxID=1653850 RepID=A0A5C6M3W6_9PLAN|nr:hypothetical protein E3A20_14190 [Planctomyces bekefii]
MKKVVASAQPKPRSWAFVGFLLLAGFSSLVRASICEDLNFARRGTTESDPKVLTNDLQLLQSESSAAVATELRRIINEAVKDPEQPIQGDQFNAMLSGVTEFARRHHIEISEKLETVGVFPEGLFKIGLSGLKDTSQKTQRVGFIRLHELGHLFHTVQLRASLLRTIDVKDPAQVQRATELVHNLEVGGNYRRFEELVYGVASPMTEISGAARRGAHFVESVDRLLKATEAASQSGKLVVAGQLTMVNAYAKFISKAPLVVGTSAKDAMFRMPFILFSAYYVVNPSIEIFISDDTRQALQARGGVTFRNWVHYTIGL